jgi:hypothetical protein
MMPNTTSRDVWPILPSYEYQYLRILGMPSVHALLVLVSSFEKRAKEEAALGSLLMALPLSLIAEMTNVNPTREQWLNWAERNLNVLNSLKAVDVRSWWRPRDGQITTDLDKKRFIWLDTKQVLPFEVDVSSQSVILGSPPLPNLYLTIGEKVFRGPPISPQLAPNAWLILAIDEIFGSANNEPIEEFAQANKSAIDRIRRWFDKMPHQIGKGSDGVVFDIGGQKVLKVFTDATAYHKAQEAVHRLHKEPLLAKTEALIYDVGELGIYKKRPEDAGMRLYWYVMERMTTVRSITDGLDNYAVEHSINHIIEDVRSEIQDNQDRWRGFKSHIKDPKHHAAISLAVKQTAIRLANYIDKTPEIKDSIERQIPNLKQEWMQDFVEELLMKYLTGRGDVAIRNLGIAQNGALRYFDPSFEGYENGLTNI